MQAMKLECCVVGCRGVREVDEGWYKRLRRKLGHPRFMHVSGNCVACVEELMWSVTRISTTSARALRFTLLLLTQHQQSSSGSQWFTSILFWPACEDCLILQCPESKVTERGLRSSPARAASHNSNPDFLSDLQLLALESETCAMADHVGTDEDLEVGTTERNGEAL
jgi:hypothetical protein